MLSNKNEILGETRLSLIWVFSYDTHDCHCQALPKNLDQMVQSVSASVTDKKFRLGELGMGSNPCLVGHHQDYHVSLTLNSGAPALPTHTK